MTAFTTLDDAVPLPQACQLLHRSRDQVVRLISIGELEGGQILGRSWVVSRTAIARYLAQRTAAQPAAQAVAP